jgi:hypothetical protein
MTVEGIGSNEIFVYESDGDVAPHWNLYCVTPVPSLQILHQQSGSGCDDDPESEIYPIMGQGEDEGEGEDKGENEDRFRSRSSSSTMSCPASACPPGGLTPRFIEMTCR